MLELAALKLENVLNNQSLVVLFTFRDKRLLFVGDAQAGKIGRLGRAALELGDQQPRRLEAALGKRAGLEALEGLAPVLAGQQEREAAGPEARRAIDAGEPAVRLVAVAAPCERPRAGPPAGSAAGPAPPGPGCRGRPAAGTA